MFAFTSNLSEISVSAGEAKATIQISRADGTKIFSNEYQSEHAFKITGIGKIIADDLRKLQLSFADYTISSSRSVSIPKLSSKPSGASIRLTAIHCPQKMNISEDTFLDSKFLFQASEIIVPKGYTQQIPIDIYTTASNLSAAISEAVTITTKSNGTITKYLQKNSISYPIAAGGDTIQLYTANLDDKRPATIIIQAGQRQLTFKFPDSALQINSTVFIFRNRFNALEILSLQGKTDISPEADKVQATIAGTTKECQIIDHTTTTITADAIRLPEAEAAAQLLLSHDVKIWNPNTATQTPIIIDSISGTISNNSKSLCSIKITYHKA